MEELFDIKGWEGLYSITKSGKVWSWPRERHDMSGGKGKWIKSHLDGCGYPFVALTRNNKTIQPKVHRLVAINFIPNPLNKPQVNHIDGNKENNNDWNLEWATPEENIQHSFKLGLSNQQGEKNSCSKLTNEDVLKIRELGDSKTIKGREIARLYKVCPSVITNIVKRKRWKHI